LIAKNKITFFKPQRRAKVYTFKALLDYLWIQEKIIKCGRDRKSLFSKTFSEKLTIISIILCTFADGFGGSLFQDIVGKKAFAIISRLAKSVGNSFGITSTEIICDRWLVYIRFA
jgi:hypothetical protein